MRGLAAAGGKWLERAEALGLFCPELVEEPLSSRGASLGSKRRSFDKLRTGGVG